MKDIFFFYLPWNSKCGYSIWSFLLLTQLPAGMTESRWDLLTFLKVPSDATQTRTKRPSWMPFMLIPESIRFPRPLLVFHALPKDSVPAVLSFPVLYILCSILHYKSKSFHCIMHSPCVVIRNVGSHFFISSQTESGKL